MYINYYWRSFIDLQDEIWGRADEEHIIYAYVLALGSNIPVASQRRHKHTIVCEHERVNQISRDSNFIARAYTRTMNVNWLH